MIHPPSRRWWQTPVLPAAFVAADAVLYGLTTDFGTFIVQFCFVIPVLVVPLAIISCVAVFRTFRKPGRRLECALAIAILMGAPFLHSWVKEKHDRLRFMAWAPFHRDLLAQVADKNGIVTAWDSWGMVATGGYDSYLVRDIDDNLTTLDAANAWWRSLRLPCEIVNTDRIGPTLYVVTKEVCDEGTKASDEDQPQNSAK